MKGFFAGLVVAAAATSASAQSSLGIQGADLRFGLVQDETSAGQSDFSARIDVAVTDHHGLQGDVIFVDTDQGLIGQLGAHLYMTPRMGQKYGLFASLSDVDGRAMTWGSLGVEGMLSLSETVTFEARAGMGVSDVNSLDYIFADSSLAIALSDNLDVEVGLTLTEFDEASFRAISYEGYLTARYSREGSPLGLYAQVIQSGLSGRDGQPGETRLGLGISLSLGQAGGVAPETRPFRTVDPVAPLVRRDLW